ncbi:MAG: methyl-accepting chemotaxis protein [Methylococcales bacterium]|nr:methyl-accepting chemotaxis protein [Methylococcales bacterium]
MKQNISIFSRMLLWQKFVILGVLAIVLVILPFAFYVVETEKKIDLAKLETKGIPPTQNLLELVRLLQIHRGSSNRLLNGDMTAAPEREAAKNKANQVVGVLENMIKNDIADKKMTTDWYQITQHWRTLYEQIENRKIGAPQAFDEHSNIIDEYLTLSDKVADYYALTLDPDEKHYAMIQAFIYSSPALTETLGKLRGFGGGLLAAKQATPAQLQRISGFMELATAQRKTALNSLEKVFNKDATIKASLGELTKSAGENYVIATGLTQKEILGANPEQLTYSPSDYFKAYTTTIDYYSKRNEKGMQILTDLLNIKAQKLRDQEIYVSSGLLLLVLIGSLVTFYIIRSITRPVSQLVDVMQKLAAGDNDIRVNPQTFDELGLMGRQFDMMVDQRELVNANIQKENETLNTSIINLLQAVAKLSQKDLTVKVPVSEDVTGLIADALNVLADETSKVLNRVVQLAGNVANVSQQVKTQSDSVILVAQEEKREVEQSNIELNNASAAMLGVAQLAVSCNEAAEKAIKNTDKAQESVLDTVQGITTIRDTIRETEKRIKRLGERSQEIGGVVNLINNIAERTHILALNASMHAASAGEAGRGFAVVANEVQRLAENSREATSKIAALVNNIQVETADTVITMNEAIGQVVKGTDLAQQAGDEMRATRETTAELVQLVQRIAADANAQVLTTQRLQERAVEITKSSEETFDKLQAQGLQTEQLVGLSNDLVESVGVFTLPAVKTAA